MPNHIQNKLVITGDADIIRRLIDTISTPNEDEGSTHYIDFNKIIPMPECLKHTEASSVSNMALAVYLYKSDRIGLMEKLCRVNTDRLYAIVDGPKYEYFKYFDSRTKIL